MRGRTVVTGGAVLAAAAAAAVTAGVVLAGPGRSPAGTVTVAARSGAPVSPASSAGSAWRARTVARLSARLTSVAVSPGRSAAFELVAASLTGDAPFRLHRISLAGGPPVAGPRFPVSQVSLAGRYAWSPAKSSVTAASRSGWPCIRSARPRCG